MPGLIKVDILALGMLSANSAWAVGIPVRADDSKPAARLPYGARLRGLQYHPACSQAAVLVIRPLAIVEDRVLLTQVGTVGLQPRVDVFRADQDSAAVMPEISAGGSSVIAANDNSSG
jgi:hypothetical protein